MDCTGKLHSVNRDWKTGKIIIGFELNEEPTEAINEIGFCEKLSITAKKYRQKRSLDANAYLWILCTKIAEAISTTEAVISKDEVYEDMLQKYGCIYQDDDGYITVTVKAEVDMNKITGHWKLLKGNGKFNSYLMIKGSSEYDSAEMARFIDAVVCEAKELGIETMTPAELERMKETWGKENIKK